MLSCFYKYAFLARKRAKRHKSGRAVGKNQLFCLLFKIGSLIFFHILHKVRGHYRVKTAPNTIFQKNFHFPKKWKKCPKMPKNRVFWLLCKFESLLFARNDLKWSVLWLANFLRKSHIWEKSRSRDLGQKWPKKGKNRFFWTFTENWVISFC